VTKEDNELKSAEYAYNDLKHLYVEPHIIEKCCKMIIATKNHQLSPDLDCFDSKFFVDIDLLILSSPRKKYFEYLKQIRKEYNIYSNEVYSQGRKKLLLKLLQRRIYQTELFFNKFEEIAKRNILYELSLL
jgi:predicted metal-dependent HD superfamily phosphohydrolase